MSSENIQPVVQQQEEGDDVPQLTQPEQEIFHLELHAWLDAQQTVHGVRHDDYGHYHSYCTRRLHRLSHLVDAKKYLVCSSKYVTTTTTTTSATTTTTATTAATTTTTNNKKTTTNKRNAYCSRNLDTLSKDVKAVPHINILWYLLVLSERCWAQSKEWSKQQQNQSNGNGKKPSQILSKLKRAVQWAETLYEKSQIVCDSSTIEECYAYLSWMKANYALEQMNYQVASQEYANAMTLCYSLSSPEPSQPQEIGEDPTATATTTQDETLRLERQDLFVTRADTLLRPLFRYCQYELRQQKATGSGNGDLLLIPEPRRRISQSMSNPDMMKNSTTSNTVEQKWIFRGTELVLDIKELRVLLLKLESAGSVEQSSSSATGGATTATTTSEESTFLNALSILDDALEVVANQLTSLNKAQTGPAVQAKVKQYLLWKGYLQYQKTLRVMDHTSQLLQTVTGHAERVHIYDALLQYAMSLLHLPRPSDMVEEEDEFALQAQANVLRLRTMKTYHMGWYYLQTNKNIKAAWSLIEHSSKLCHRAQEEIAACDQDMLHAEDYLEELENIPYDSARIAIRAAYYIQTGGVTGSTPGGGGGAIVATQRPLLLRLEEEDPGMVLAGDIFPIPIPCKPIFYDLALQDTLDTVGSLDVLQQYVTKHTVVDDEQTNSTKGKGFFGGLFG